MKIAKGEEVAGSPSVVFSTGGFGSKMGSVTIGPERLEKIMKCYRYRLRLKATH